MPPPLHDGSLDTLGRHSTVATSSSRRDDDHEGLDERNPNNAALFGDLPEGKRRKFILVDDTQRGCRVRVKVMLDQVDMNEIPDSYRMSNSVYPRAYFPLQMKSPPGRVVPGKRYFDDDEAGDDDGSATVGRTLVPAPTIDGEAEIAVPKLSRSKHNTEVLLNDLGYRMSWSQSRVFAGRMLFLQRSCAFDPLLSLHVGVSNRILLIHILAVNSGCVPQQNAPHHDRCRPRSHLHRTALRNTGREAEMAGTWQEKQCYCFRFQIYAFCRDCLCV